MVEYMYDAWGNHSVSGSKASTIGVLNPFRYRSYFFDKETGLYYLQSRYYDPEVGRFLNMDSFYYADPEIINGLNLYAYCCNDPVNYYDPTGNFIISIGLSLTLAGVGLGAALLGWLEYTYHPIQNTVEAIGDAVADIIDNIHIDNVQIDNPITSNSGLLISRDLSFNLLLTSNNTLDTGLHFSRERNRGKDSGFIGVSDQDLIDMLNEAKRNNDSALIQRILKEMKMRGLRNSKKQRGGPHMRGFFLLFYFLAKGLKEVNRDAN